MVFAVIVVENAVLDGFWGIGRADTIISGFEAEAELETATAHGTMPCHAGKALRQSTAIDRFTFFLCPKPTEKATFKAAREEPSWK